MLTEVNRFFFCLGTLTKTPFIRAQSQIKRPFFRNVLKKFDTYVIAISYGDHCYGIIKNGKECFVYDPPRLNKIG